MKIKLLGAIGLLIFLHSCRGPVKTNQLPVLGHKEYIEGDTIYETIRDFSFVNQDSAEVTNTTFANKIYVVDFFFTSCPTICPKVKKQMMRIHEEFQDESELLFLSHSIDTKRDTVARLKQYANLLDIDQSKWHFVTGEKDSIYAIAEDYFSIAHEDPDAPGGFDHSGRLILVDEKRRVRSFCNGTEAEDVDRFMKDIVTLLNE